MNLASIYIATCIGSIGVTFLLGAPDRQGLVLLSALSISLIGVPHGGLDHWTGRRLLVGRFGNSWWLFFFPVYFVIAVSFAAAWYIASIVTVLSFFIVSAWHFGREDEKAIAPSNVPTTQIAEAEHRERPISLRYLRSLLSIAVGGLVVWVPSVFRSDEMLGLLRMIIPASGTGDAQQVLLWTQGLSVVLVPIAGLVVIKNILSDVNNWRHWVPVATVAISILTPILLSFTIYFCGWHSIQGLRRLQRQEQLTNVQFVSATLPLSIVAVTGIGFLGWFFQDVAAAFASGEQATMLQTLFIGLSAIAVPHLLLHEMEDAANSFQQCGTWQTSNSCPDTPSIQKGIAS